MMKVGFGLYRHMLNEANYAFARQCGATHIVAHLVDYTRGSEREGVDNQPVGGGGGWGAGMPENEIWTAEGFMGLKRDMARYGLELYAIENFDPAHWYDVLLDGPLKREQIERLKKIIRSVGKAGIPVFGYNFSLAGVTSRLEGEFARGGAVSVGMVEVDRTPVPRGMVWNMIYDVDAYKQSEPDPRTQISHDELWDRLSFFLRELVPVAEESGVRLAAHPDDPPAPEVRQTPRLVYRPSLYDRLLDIVPSRANSLEFCLGTVAEMPHEDPYEALDRYSSRGSIAYVHLRNVVGTVPDYRETFIDEGKIDIPRAMRILSENRYDGIVIPDHTPQMSCGSPWHAGMAFAMGYIAAVSQGIGR